MKRIVHVLSGQHRQLALHQVAYPLSDPPQLDSLINKERHNLTSRVHAGISSTGGMQGAHRPAENYREIPLKLALHRAQTRLFLPAVKASPVVLNDQLYVRHTNTRLVR